MAAILKLVLRKDEAITASDISSISLINNTDGFNLDYLSGWTPAVASGMDPANLVETMALIARGSSHDNLAALRQAFDLKLKQAAWYWDSPAEPNSVWLRAKLDGETYERQACIRRANARWGDSPFGPYVDAGFTDRAVPFALERLPWWEDTARVTDTNLNVGCDGDAVTVTGTLGGDVPGRVSSTYLSPNTGDQMDEAWIGFRSHRWGNMAQFVSKWPTGSGTVVAGTGTTDEGDWMSCDFSAGDPDGEAMQTRFYVEVQDVTANYSAQRGEFIVLLRAQKGGGSTECYVRMLDGYGDDDDNLRQQDRVRIRRTDWCLHPLGTICIPPVSGPSSATLLKTFRIAIQAERTAGTDDLNCDYLILIPIGEGGVHVTNMAMTAGQYASLYTFPHGVMSGWTFTDSNLTDVIVPVAPGPQGPYGYSVPSGPTADCNAIVAFQRATEHDETDLATVTFCVLRRWRTLRGAQA